MNPMNLLALPFRYKPWLPRHLKLIMADIGGTSRYQPADDRAHLEATIDWLCRAQDVRNGQVDAGGVSAGWSFEDGWLPSYPETTGYIIETFIAAANVLQRPELLARAHRMIDWELSIQQDDGAFPGHFGEAGSRPVIFNTGQIMHGMNAGYIELGRQDCLEAAVRAGDWLIRHQDADGCWRKFEHNDTPHVYNTRGTWALLRAGLASGEDRLVQGAIKHLDWALAQQTPSGWYGVNAFTPDKSPFTHTIAYAIRGFLESGVLLKEERYLNSARIACEGLAKAQRDDGWLAGTYGDYWRETAKYSCVTGVAQMALNWTRLDQELGLPHLREASRKAIEYVKRNQAIAADDDIIRGGVVGSVPIWGDYSRFEYPNWAAKFYADALLMELRNQPVPSTAIAPSAAGEAA